MKKLILAVILLITGLSGVSASEQPNSGNSGGGGGAGSSIAFYRVVSSASSHWGKASSNTMHQFRSGGTVGSECVTTNLDVATPLSTLHFGDFTASTSPSFNLLDGTNAPGSGEQGFWLQVGFKFKSSTPFRVSDISYKLVSGDSNHLASAEGNFSSPTITWSRTSLVGSNYQGSNFTSSASAITNKVNEVWLFMRMYFTCNDQAALETFKAYFTANLPFPLTADFTVSTATETNGFSAFATKTISGASRVSITRSGVTLSGQRNLPLSYELQSTTNFITWTTNVVAGMKDGQVYTNNLSGPAKFFRAKQVINTNTATSLTSSSKSLATISLQVIPPGQD